MSDRVTRTEFEALKARVDKLAEEADTDEYDDEDAPPRKRARRRSSSLEPPRQWAPIELDSPPPEKEVVGEADEDADDADLQDAYFLSRMDVKLVDAARPRFTAEEAARWATLVSGEQCLADSEFITDFCLERLNEERDDSCLYK